ncbi:PREDICTED: caspase-1-like [Amphimedon queenslandica]|uniref:Caspase family p20 domain-containing protein n=1 Tax=Amphimedon queenslandica TaxID=400682 RepID=A0A1X7VP55_AMPQE|nr:PREDICTED: caspase-1-like [Amphimedon queenslandica]|eukprot:XP_019862743.1 PREDICTED: caspase-1-like [Amphimedon queenslandica]
MGNKQSRSRSSYEEGNGYVLIFNNVNFTTKELETRTGSDRNAEEIKHTFEQRCCRVKTLRNRTTIEMTTALENVKRYEEKNFLFVFFLTHGDSSGVYGTDGVLLRFQDIQKQLTAGNFPAFSRKPKILVFPTCRKGEREDSGTRAVEDDFLLAFGTQPNSSAYRFEEEGSYYITQLLSVIETRGDREDLLSMLTEVKRVMRDQQDVVPQNPDYHSSLTDKVFLRQKKSSAQLITGKNNRHRERAENAGIEEEEESQETVCTPATSSALSSYDVVSGKTLDAAKIYKSKTKTGDSTKNSSPKSSISSSDDDTEVCEGIFPDDNIDATVPFYPPDQDSQPIEQELPAEAATEKSKQEWLDVSGDHDITPQGTPEDEITATLTKSIGNTRILKSKVTEEGYIEIVKEIKELTVGEIENDWIVLELS